MDAATDADGAKQPWPVKRAPPGMAWHETTMPPGQHFFLISSKSGPWLQSGGKFAKPPQRTVCLSPGVEMF